MKAVRLGINVDHVATIRQARKTLYPSPLQAALMAESAGADGITLHLREDRRHIIDSDVIQMKQTLSIPMNLEMAATGEMVEIALANKPDYVCLVPEKREELTTEGGLDVFKFQSHLKDVTETLLKAGIQVSLFIEPDRHALEVACYIGAPIVELHTGQYAELKGEQQQSELARVKEAASFGHELGLIVNAGHGLHYHNVHAIAAIPEMNELNIGHSIVAQAIFEGMTSAVSRMKQLCLMARA